MEYVLGWKLERIIKIGDLQDTYRIVRIDRTQNIYQLMHEQSQTPFQYIIESKENLDRFFNVIDRPRGHF